MSKYSEQFKLAMVQQYSSGTAGYRQLANEYKVPDSMVRLWVRRYRAHGTDGQAKEFSHYSAEFKLAFCGLCGMTICRTRGGSGGNIRNPDSFANSERRYHSGDLGVLPPRKRRRTKKMPPLPNT